LPKINFPTQLATTLSNVQDTRVKQGLKNRQMIQRTITTLITPLHTLGRTVALDTRHYIETNFDRKPTKIANIRVNSLTPTSATIAWDTNHLSRSSKVNYGTSTSYGQEVFEGDALTDHHQVTITDLQPETLYYFEVMNQQRDYVFDAYYTLTTPKEGTSNNTAPLLPQIATLTQDTEVRKEPNPEAEVLHTFKTNTSYRALLTQDGWVAILLPTGGQGWVPVSNVTLKDQTGESETAENRGGE
jgi:hypothetical protein